MILLRSLKSQIVSREFFRSKSSFAFAMSEGLKEIQERSQVGKEKVPYKSRYDIRRNKNKRLWEDETRTPEEIAAKKASMTPEDKLKRKKSVLLMGYSGANYFGMQRNPGQKTIEEDLFVAMFKNKWITEESFNQAQYANFQRAARTDKGVSASRQICSMKLPDEVDVETLNKDLPDQIKVFCVRRVTKGFNSKEQCDARTYSYTLPTIAFADHSETVEMEKYRAPAEKLEKMNELLKMFLGTKNFHNFTSRKEFIDPSSKRYIISFKCEAPRVEGEVEYCTIKIKGQSFMLHQIRKMVGLTLAVLRGHTDPPTINRAFTADRLDLPMAPGLGLVLDQVHYDRYNRRYGVDGIHKSLEWDELEPEIKAFGDKFIYPTIYETELKDKSMALWLETLHYHSYTVRPEDLEKSAAQEKEPTDDVEVKVENTLKDEDDKDN
ncbi:PUS1 family protein [Megaselia abdita]